MILSHHGLVYQSDCSVSFQNSNPYSLHIDNQRLKRPELTCVGGYGLRLYANDFCNFTETGSTVSTVNTIQSFKLFVFDINTQTYLLENYNTFTHHTLEEDSVGKYYMDFRFNDILDFMNNDDGDYLIVIVSQLTNRRSITNGRSYSCLYTSTDYFRYQYYADSKTGSLVPSDSEGNPKKPTTDDPTPEDPNKRYH